MPMAAEPPRLEAVKSAKESFAANRWAEPVLRRAVAPIKKASRVQTKKASCKVFNHGCAALFAEKLRFSVEGLIGSRLCRRCLTEHVPDIQRQSGLLSYFGYSPPAPDLSE